MSIPSDIFIGGLQIHLYSLFFAGGLLAGYFIARRQAIKKGISEQIFDTTALFIIAFGLLGARLFYVLGHWHYYGQNPDQIIQFWKGGLAFYGGLIGGAGALAAANHYYRVRVLTFLDSMALALPLGQAIGRLGNFFNQEAFGRPTDLPWRLYVDPSKRPAGYENLEYFHPTFGYEILGLLIIFCLTWFLGIRIKTAGYLFVFYAIASGLLRAFIESLRLDALRFGSLMISQLAAIVLMIIGLILLIFIANGRQTK